DIPCYLPLDPILPSWSANLRQSFLTKPHQGFTLVHPSRFSLARSVPLAGHRLRRYPQLRTSPLPVTHVGIGNRLWTLAWVDWFPTISTTHAKRPRIAHGTENRNKELCRDLSLTLHYLGIRPHRSRKQRFQ